MPDTRVSLILRLPKSADSAAWREFIELYEPLMLRFARKRGLQESDARELVQRVFISVAGAVDRWQPHPGKGKFRAWLFCIARNHLIKQMMAGKRERPVGGTSHLFRLNDQLDRSSDQADELQQEYRRAVFDLAAARVQRAVAHSTWQAFWQTLVEERQCDEVARELGLSVGAVYIARSRVIARLRDTVQQLEGEDALDG
jgi:RNA polymerase sigma-70 factor (ECF subfamily)